MPEVQTADPIAPPPGPLSAGAMSPGTTRQDTATADATQPGGFAAPQQKPSWLDTPNPAGAKAAPQEAPQDHGTFGNLAETLRKGEESQQEAFRRSEEGNRRAQEGHNVLAAGMGPLNAQLQQPTPAPPKLQSVAQPPPSMTEQDSQNMLGFVGAMAMFGAIGSKFARIPAEAALSAFGSALKGYKEGNQQQFENSYKQWEAQTKATIQNNGNLIEQYRQVLENKKLDIAHMQTAWQNVALVNQDQVGIDIAKSGSAQSMANYYNKLATTQQKAESSFDKLSQKGGGQSPEDFDKQAQQYISQGGTGMSLVQVRQPGFQQAIDRQLQSQGMTRADLAKKRIEYISATAQGRTIGTRAGNIDVSAEEARGVAELAREANRNLPRPEFTPFNQLAQGGQRMTSNPAYIELNTYTQGLITAYGATMSRSGVNTVSAQERAAHVVNTAMGQQGYDKAVESLLHEIDVVERAPENARRHLAQSLMGGGAQQPTPGGSPATGASATPGALKTIKNSDKASYDALKSGDQFLDEKGKTWTKP
jgi:hypothetical protein